MGDAGAYLIARKAPTESEFSVNKIKNIRAVAVVALALSAVFFSGCAQMNLAVSVGKDEITVAALQKQVTSILSERTKIDISQLQLPIGEELTRTQLQFMIMTFIINSIAIDGKLDITAKDIADYRKLVYQQIGGESELTKILVNASIAPSDLDSVLRRDIIISKLNDQALAAGVSKEEASAAIQDLVKSQAIKLKVVVNPRYGTWNESTANLEAKEAAGNAVTPKP